MKNIAKVMATASLLAMAAMPIAASAQDATSAASPNGQAAALNQVKVVPGTMGQITDFVNDKSGKFITVTGRGLAPTDQSEIVLSITPSTKIVDARGKTVPLQSIIDQQKVVKAFYSPNITKSLPARGTALTLVVQDQSFTAVNGTVTEVSDGRFTVSGTNMYTGYDDTIILHLAEKAQIVDENGKIVTADAIQKGMSVQAFYGPAVALSLPPQSTTNYVKIQQSDNEAVQEDANGTSGIITGAKDHKFTLDGKPMAKGGVNHVILTVDEKTQIVDEKGNPLTEDALKEDVRIDAYYPEVMLMIYPAQAHADKIVVKDVEKNKIEGTIAEWDSSATDKVYVNVGSDQSRENDVILGISKDTLIIPTLGADEKLKPGMKIVAYHSPIMLKSMPPITSAEIIIIQSDKE